MRGFRIGRIFGIEVAIHPSWFVVLVLFSFSLAISVFPRAYAAWSPLTTWTVAVIATLLLFVCVLAHELGHSLVARSQGIPVKNITLFLLGGVSTIESEAASPGREMLLAGAGPLVSLAVGAASWGLAGLVTRPEPARAVLLYLGIANLSLAVFNLLPGFPLDGGRVLRALFWWRSRNFAQATRRAATVGQGFGYAFIVLAALAIVSGALVTGIWLGFIGWMLTQASRASAAQADLDRELEGVTALRLMTQPQVWLKPLITLRAAAERGFRDYDTRCLPVESEDSGETFGGLLCLRDLTDTQRPRWDTDRVRDVMSSARTMPAVEPETPALDVVRTMRLRRQDLVAVMGEGGLLGFIDPAGIDRFVRLRHEAEKRQARAKAA
jgi:Zn-dependent protease